MMYDREGDNLPYINKYFDFETTHGTRFQTKTSESTGDGGSTGGEDEEGNGDASVQENEPWNLRYYDFTIMQLLRLYPSNIVYNNKDGIIDRAIIRSDFDKRLTLTQCRYSAKQLYGIEEVLVVDFDEFLYCPRATLGKKLFSGGGNIGIAMGPSRRLEEENQVDTRNLNSLTITTPMPNVAQQQRDFYDAYTLHLMNKGIDQFILKQRVVVSKYGDMRECLMQQYYDMEAYVTAHTIGHNSTLKFAKNQVEYPLPLRPSLFHCISSFHYGIKMFFEKTQHLSHACPYTSFHYASNLRQFDCHTTSYMSTSKTRRHYHTQGCSVIHITTKSNQYNRTHNYDWNKIMNEEYNQLYALSYGPWN